MFALFDELQMLRVILIFVLHPFRLKLQVQGNLVTLINHRAMAWRHFAGVKLITPGMDERYFLAFATTSSVAFGWAESVQKMTTCENI